MLVLIWVQIVCKYYQQTTIVDNGLIGVAFGNGKTYSVVSKWWWVGLGCKRSIQEVKTILYDFFKKSELLYVKSNCFFILLHIIYIGYIRVNQYAKMF